MGDEQAVYADRAYEDKARRRRLRAGGQGPDQTSPPQVLAPAAALAAASQRADRTTPRSGGTGLRHPQQHYGYRRALSRPRATRSNCSSSASPTTSDAPIRCSAARGLNPADSAQAAPHAPLEPTAGAPRTPHPAPRAPRRSNRDTPQSRPRQPAAPRPTSTNTTYAQVSSGGAISDSAEHSMWSAGERAPRLAEVGAGLPLSRCATAPPQGERFRIRLSTQCGQRGRERRGQRRSARASPSVAARQLPRRGSDFGFG